MEKIITPKHGNKIKVETEGSLFGFMASDIITRDKDFKNDCWWKNQKVLVEGFRNGELWGTIEGEKKSLREIIPDGLILLKRPSLEFEVGDEGKAIMGGEVKVGKIVVINPYEYEDLPFLVEFENFVGGHDGNASWKKPWYPNQYKTKSDSRWWAAEDDLEFFVEKAPHKKIIWREKPDLREAT